jgi:plasmid stability protein
LEADVTQMLVRDLPPEVVERLKNRARSNGRSLQKEVRAILEGAARRYTMAEARKVSEGWHERLAGTEHSDSAELIREDRDA